ncbi:unnamed protein product, partial [Ectocarpus fasciculatus]
STTTGPAVGEGRVPNRQRWCRGPSSDLSTKFGPAARRGEIPDLALRCYEGLAIHFFNGGYGRTSERRAKGNVTAADDPILERLMEILRFLDD